MGKEINKTSLITITIYVLSFLLIYFIAYPLYSGRGVDLFNQSNVIYEYTKTQELQSYYELAQEFKNQGLQQVSAYQNINPLEKDRINIAIPENLDISRLINDLDKIADNTNIKSSSINFGKSNNNSDSNEKLSVYKLSYTVNGSYNDFKNYIRVIENNLQLLNIQKLSFRPDKAENLKPFESYQFSLEMEAYGLK
ncbi:MAG: hypothetical protein QG614_161 [Patescibacteria group bacterium]|nr:hypothetical protein [Bacillota bacterium]MDQ5957186.1 hypothetical protein [Patescibacteria group bacterium]